MKTDYAVLTDAIKWVENPDSNGIEVKGPVTASMIIADTVDAMPREVLGVPHPFGKSYATERIFRKFMMSKCRLPKDTILFGPTNYDTVLVDYLKAIRRTLR